jgi:hypothetical protein
VKVGDLVMMSARGKRHYGGLWYRKQLHNATGIIVGEVEGGTKKTFLVKWNHTEITRTQPESRENLKMATTKEYHSKGGRKKKDLVVGDFVEMSAVGRNKNRNNFYYGVNTWKRPVVGKVIEIKPSYKLPITVDWTLHQPDEGFKPEFRTGEGRYTDLQQSHQRKELKRASVEKTELWCKADKYREEMAEMWKRIEEDD